MDKILIKNGEIVTDSKTYLSDILLSGGKIVSIAEKITDTADRTIDAQGKYIFPGGIDPHVHLDMPFMGEVSADNFESGTAAAVAGGTTFVIDFVIPGRGQSLLEALQGWHNKAKNAVTDYSYHMAVTWFDDSVAREMEQCVQNEGIPSFKVFLAYKGAIGVSDAELLQTMKKAKELGALVNTHCENAELVAYLQDKLFAEGKIDPKYHALSRPSYVEGYGTHTVITFAEATGCPVYIVHVTCQEAISEIAQAKARGVQVFGETCPQYLLLDGSVYEKENFESAAYVMSPPIRPKGHDKALWDGVQSGNLEVIGTDHCPFNLKGQKELGRDDFRKIPNGAAGIEERLKLLYSYGVLENKISLNQFVDLTSTRAAKIYGLYPQKGAIMVDSDADLVIWDPEIEGIISAKTHHQKVDTNIFEGFKTKGSPAFVLVGGKVVFEEGNLNVKTGAGRFIKRQAVH